MFRALLRLCGGSENRARRVSHYFFGCAANQRMFESCPPVCRRDDNIDMATFCERANLPHWRSNRDRGLKFHTAEFCRAEEFSHLPFGSLARCVLQNRKVVHSKAISGVGIAQIKGAEDD